MSIGPPEDYEHHMDAADAAEPTRPSERGAWRGHWDDDEDDEGASSDQPAAETSVL